MPQAEFERICAAREREFVLLEADRAELQRLRARSLSQEHELARVDIERLSSEIRRRAARLGADAVDLDRQRASLRGRVADRHRAKARDVETPRRERDEARDFSTQGTSQHAAAALKQDVEHARQSVRLSAQSLSEVFGRAAEVLDDSAMLAEDHADRQDRAGRSDAAAHERRLATRARDAAQRARLHAQECLEFGGREW